jgi:hypothetical protein
MPVSNSFSLSGFGKRAVLTLFFPGDTSLLVDLWRSMISGPPIDEQEAERQARAVVTTIAGSSRLVDIQSCDPNDFAPMGMMSVAPSIADQLQKYYDDDDDDDDDDD